MQGGFGRGSCTRGFRAVRTEVTLQSVLDTQWTQEKREGGIVIVAMFQSVVLETD